MIKNYFKIAWRSIKYNKFYSIINIAGLTIGLTACFLISTVVLNDLSYDKQWSKSSDLYRIISNNISTGEKMVASPLPLGPQLKNDFPQVESYARMTQVDYQFEFNTDKVKINCIRSEKSIWDLLDFEAIEGTPHKFIEGYDNLVITKKLKQEYFPNENPVGKIVSSISNYQEPTDYIITGVVENFPVNSHLRSDALVLRASRPLDDVFSSSGGVTWGQQYLLLKTGVSAQSFSTILNDWYKSKTNDKNHNLEFSLQPIEDIYLNSKDYYQEVKGSLTNVKILSGIAIMLMLIACINFINLNTARTLKRVKTTGLHKVLGATRKTLITQFLSESFLFFAISSFLAFILYYGLLPNLEAFVGNELPLNIIDDFGLLSLYIVVILIVSLLTGIYPAWLLSKPNAVEIISNTFRVDQKSESFRKGLVVLQFILAVGIIISSVVVNSQINYLNHKDLGFNKHNLLKVGFGYWGEKGQAFKKEVKNIPGVKDASLSKWTPSNGGGYFSMEIEDPNSKDDKLKIWYIESDIDLTSTLELEVIKGRGLDSKFISDSSNPQDSLVNITEADASSQPIMLTEYTAERLGVTELNIPYKDLKGIPVGIVKNFHNESLRTPLGLTAIKSTTNPSYGYFLVRLEQDNIKETLGRINDLYLKFYPNNVFDFSWIDEELAKEFRAEAKLQTILKGFSGLIVFLSCLGLFGLITFIIHAKMKEISIHKVLGASVSQIVIMFSKNSIKLIFIASLIAIPISWYFLNKWLQEFPFRVELKWISFFQSVILVALIALSIIGIRIFKSAITNPADNLRKE